MIIGFTVFFLLLLLSDVCLWLSAGSVWAVSVLSLPTLAIAGAFVAVRRGFYHNTFIRLFFALVLLCAIPKLVYVVFSLLGLWQLGLALAVLIILFVGYGFFFGWRRIVVRTASCESALLPCEFEGYRIVQLSDLHLGTFRRNPSFVRKMVRVVEDRHPDLIVFTGDLVNVGAEEVVPFLKDLKQLHAPDGIYSVMGNHDYCEYSMKSTHGRETDADRHHEPYAARNRHVLQYLEEKIGWHLLLNDHVLISRMRADGNCPEATIALIGVENISRPPFPDYGDLRKAMEGLPEGMFKVLLSHDPSHWRRGVVRQTDIALTLSGHTHAGQVKVARFSPAKWAYQEWGGKYTEGASMLYVSLGLGGTMPFRFGAWPEVNVIELRRG